MSTPRVVTFHGLRPTAWLDALSEIWLERLGDPALLACHVDVHGGAGVRLDLLLPEGRLQLARAADPADGDRGLLEALHACFLTVEQLLHDRRRRVGGTSRRPRVLTAARRADAHAPG